MNLENIPDEMKKKKQWVCYRSYYNEQKGKFVKIIVSPITGKFAKCNDSQTWSDYSQACDFYKRKKMQGLAFALNSDLIFIDIDHAIEGSTVTSIDAKELMEHFSDTYIERSCSGAGIHILVKGSLPREALNRNDKRGIEMYDSNRFICLTGDLLSASTRLKDSSGEIAMLNEKYIGKRPAPLFRDVGGIGSINDDRLIEIIARSRQGEKFCSLMDGYLAAYESHSSADFALVSILAFWTQDKVQIDRIFRRSGLMREKWDRHTGGTTYGERTIENALRFQGARIQSQM